MADDDGYIMRDYYEVLKVAIDCTEADIRKAYKKAALRCHPDKNPGRIEEAAEEFKEVQQAYGVLVDEKERAWYDTHKDAVLRGGQGGDAQAPDEMNLFDYVTPRCFSGYADEGLGFFAVYKHCFETIAKEEAKDWKLNQATQASQGGGGGGKQQPCRKCPSFGDSTTAYDDGVGDFYQFWSDYSTKKSFSWKDEYKAHDMPDRFQRRKAEQINQKERAQAKKEYNDLVQNLVRFVKRRDPRVAKEEERRAELEELQAEEKLQKDIEKGKRQHVANMKLWEEMAAEEAIKDAEEEEKFQQMLDAGEIDERGYPIGMDELVEKRRQAEEAVLAEEEAEKAALKAEVHICEACGGSSFKGATSWTAHQNSKKHKANLRTFKKKGPAAPTAGGGTPAATSTADVTPAPSNPSSPTAAEATQEKQEVNDRKEKAVEKKTEGGGKKEKRRVDLLEEKEPEAPAEEEEEPDYYESKKNKNKKKKKKAVVETEDEPILSKSAKKKAAQAPLPPSEESEAPAKAGGKKLSKKEKMKQQQAQARDKLKGNALDKEEKFSESEGEGSGSEEEEEDSKPSFGGGFAALGKGKKGKR